MTSPKPHCRRSLNLPPCILDISIKLFRPDENAKRIRASAKRILMEPPPEELFIKACKMAVNVSRWVFFVCGTISCVQVVLSTEEDEGGEEEGHCECWRFCVTFLRCTSRCRDS